MDQHKLASVCAYINDFMIWNLKDKSLANTMLFVQDRFSQCSEKKKKTLCEIFNKFSTKISTDGKSTSDTSEVTSALFKIL